MRRTWVKLYCNQWLRGSIRKEPIEVRAIFTDLLMMAGDSAYGDDGLIQLADGVGFTDELIAGILNVSIETWIAAKERLSNHPDPKENRIKVASLSQGFAIQILNWKKYQNEYRRQKTYRDKKKEEKSPTPPKEEKKNIKEGEGEGEGYSFVTKVTKKVTKEKELPPIPKNTNFKTQDHLEQLVLDRLDWKKLLKDENAMRLRGYEKEEIIKKIQKIENEYCETVKALNGIRG